MNYVDSMSMFMKHDILMSNVDGSYVNEVMNDKNNAYNLL